MAFPLLYPLCFHLATKPPLLGAARPGTKPLPACTECAGSRQRPVGATQAGGSFAPYCSGD